VRIEPLTLDNFGDYEALTGRGDDGKTCYCSFWHQKVTSMEAYDAAKRENPLALREIVRSRVVSGFHVGALAYDDGGGLLAWISIGPLPEVYWAWRRVAALGDSAAKVAAITCLALAPGARARGVQTALAQALRPYAKQRGWAAIEAYPFEEAAARTNPALAWPGYEGAYRAAGYARLSDHWLSKPPQFARAIYRVDVS
jgi:GNAT superfamily N-acetyltransferase